MTTAQAVAIAQALEAGVPEPHSTEGGTLVPLSLARRACPAQPRAETMLLQGPQAVLLEGRLRKQLLKASKVRGAGFPTLLDHGVPDLPTYKWTGGGGG